MHESSKLTNQLDDFKVNNSIPILDGITTHTWIAVCALGPLSFPLTIGRLDMTVSQFPKEERTNRSQESLTIYISIVQDIVFAGL